MNEYNIAVWWILTCCMCGNVAYYIGKKAGRRTGYSEAQDELAQYELRLDAQLCENQDQFDKTIKSRREEIMQLFSTSEFLRSCLSDAQNELEKLR